MRKLINIWAILSAILPAIVSIDCADTVLPVYSSHMGSIDVRVPLAVPGADRVSAVVAVPGSMLAIAARLYLTGDVAHGRFVGVPSGLARSVLVHVRDDADSLVCAGAALVDVATSAVVLAHVIVLCPLTGPIDGADGDTAEAPRIKRIDIDPPYVAPGGTVRLSATAVHAHDDAAMLVHAWHDDGAGVYEEPDARTTAWTAPDVAGVYVHTVSVATDDGATARACVAILVR